MAFGVGEPGPRPLEALLEPAPLGRVGDVHVLESDGRAVGAAELGEHLAQRHLAARHEVPGGEAPVEVPRRQAVARQGQVRVAAGPEGDGVQVGDEMPARTVGVDEARHPRGLAELVGRVVFDVALPGVRLGRHVEGPEDPVVEAVQARQLGLQQAQELARRRSLDDAVVVRGGQGEDLGDPHARQREVRGPGEPGRIGHRADADDRALARHEARHRLGGADPSGVRQGHRRPLEVLDAEAALPAPADEVLVGGEELAEGHELGVLDRGDDERARAVGTVGVDGQAEVDVLGPVDGGPAVLQRVGAVHVRHLDERLDHGVGDQVGEAHLAAPRRPQAIVDEGAVVEHRLDGDLSEGRRRRDGQRGVHVRRDRLGGAPHAGRLARGERVCARGEAEALGVGGQGRARGRQGRRRQIRARGDRLIRVLARIRRGADLDLRASRLRVGSPVRLRPAGVHRRAPLRLPPPEELAPLRGDPRGIVEECDIEVLDETLIRPEVTVRLR